MSSFRFREVQAKLLCALRLKWSDPGRWVSKLQRIKVDLKIKTKWGRRLEFCARTIGYSKREWDAVVLEDREVKQVIKLRQVEKWREDMADRSSLAIYAQQKTAFGGVDYIYDNSDRKSVV